jgi:hypothetical protein
VVAKGLQRVGRNMIVQGKQVVPLQSCHREQQTPCEDDEEQLKIKINSHKSHVIRLVDPCDLCGLVPELRKLDRN